MFAVSYRQPEAMKLLLEHSAQPDQTMIIKSTALHYANFEQGAALFMLLDGKANIDKKDGEGQTALMHANCGPPPLQLVGLLLRRKADSTLRDNQGRTVSDLGQAGADFGRSCCFPCPEAPPYISQAPTKKHFSFSTHRCAEMFIPVLCSSFSFVSLDTP